VLSLALATERGRVAAVRLSGRPLGWLAFLLLPGLALAYEWGAGAIFDAAGWLDQEESVWVLIYKRLPLYAAAVLALAFVLSRRRASPPGSARSQSGSAPTLTVTTSRGPVEIALDDIEAIIAAENYVELCLIDGRQYLHRATLMSMNALLSSNGIVRVHRSASINAAHVIEQLPQRRLRLRSGRIVRVGRAFRDALPLAALPPSSRR
jgi:LytTr DNA-binding domain-containing protein